jgi:hypothetical protein
VSSEGVQVNWIGGRDLWRVGFFANAIQLITNLSGLVEVLEVIWQEEDQVLVFIIRNKDRSGRLFRMVGGLEANPIFKYRVPDQGIAVESKASAFAQEVH